MNIDIIIIFVTALRGPFIIPYPSGLGTVAVCPRQVQGGVERAARSASAAVGQRHRRILPVILPAGGQEEVCPRHAAATGAAAAAEGQIRAPQGYEEARQVLRARFLLGGMLIGVVACILFGGKV